MSLFPHMLGHHEAPEAANDNMKLAPEMQAVKETTLNRFYEIMSNAQDLEELKMNIAANDNAEEMQLAA